jgi:glycosidase
VSGFSKWWQRGVVYQVYPRSFRDRGGDGVGDLRGMLEKLDYLAWLGVDAIWISPFYPSPNADFGYDVTDYCDVDPLFGTLADFDRLTAAAHARGLKVVVDYVPNHTSDQHPWFRSSRASRASPHRDWYVWRDPGSDGGSPNNWIGAFGGPAWAWDEPTGQYYLHSFLPQQPDLNWRNPAVREAMYGVLRFWLDRGVDGFRMDALNRILKDPDLRDNPPLPPGTRSHHKAMGDYDTQDHRYDRGHPDLHVALREIRLVLDAYSTPDAPRVAIGEMHIYDMPELCSYYGGDALDELHLPFNFGLLKVPWAARAIGELVRVYEAALPPGAWPNYVVGNHDEPRIATRVGPAGARLAMLMLLTLRGTPTLYYGDELGLPDVPIPPAKQQDPWGHRVPGLYLGRDPCRAPMPWDAGPNAGFCPPEARPWLPLNADHASVNVAAQQADPASMLSFTRALLALRRATPALSVGSYRPLTVPGTPEDCLVFARAHAGDEVLVALNFGAAACTLDPDGRADGEVLLGTHPARAGERLRSSGLALAPHEGCIVRLCRAEPVSATAPVS